MKESLSIKMNHLIPENSGENGSSDNCLFSKLL